MDSISHSRRKALRQLAAAGAAVAAGCGHVPIAQKTYQAVTTPLPDPDAYPATSGQIAASPYASLGAQFRGQPKVVMTLATVDAERLNWVSSNHVMLSTQGGVVVATRGLPVDLIDKTPLPQQALELRPGERLEAPTVGRQRTAPRSGHQEEVEVVSRFRHLGGQRVEILNQDRNVWLLEEAADYRSWRWETINRYWVDPLTGFVWRSRQQFTPELEPLTLEVLKPYG